MHINPYDPQFQLLDLRSRLMAQGLTYTAAMQQIESAFVETVDRFEKQTNVTEL